MSVPSSLEPGKKYTVCPAVNVGPVSTTVEVMVVETKIVEVAVAVAGVEVVVVDSVVVWYSVDVLVQIEPYGWPPHLSLRAGPACAVDDASARRTTLRMQSFIVEREDEVVVAETASVERVCMNREL